MALAAHSIRRRPWLAAGSALAVTAVIIAGCTGFATFATSITSTGATLNYTATCADTSTTNPCTAWGQYWQDGSATLTSTTHEVENTVYTNAPWSQAVTGLTAGDLYHYQACGFGDTNVQSPGVCIGTAGGNFLTTPGDEMQPVPAWNGQYPVYDLSGFASFRTANPSASPATTGVADLGRVISTADIADYNTSDNGPGARGTTISRDGGISVAYSTSPPKSIWLFGDTGYSCVNSGGPGANCVFQPGTTAASGSYTAGQAPTALNELPTPPTPIPTTPPTIPAQLLKSVLPANDCTGLYSAAWTGGGALIPSSTNVLMTFADECVSSSNFIAQGFTLQPYTPSSNTLGTAVTPFLKTTGITPLEALNSPIFGTDGYLYLYSATNVLAAPGYPNAVYVARVAANATAWSNSANYKWYSASGWTTEAHATSVVTLPNNVIPIGVSVGNFTASSKGYVILMQTTFGDNSPSNFTTFYGTSPSGPFTTGVSGQTPDGCTQHQPTTGFGCYALAVHPELSSSAQLVFSYFAPDDRLNNFTYAQTGHIRLAAVAW
jgi:hypothetical protein